MADKSPENILLLSKQGEEDAFYVLNNGGFHLEPVKHSTGETVRDLFEFTISLDLNLRNGRGRQRIILCLKNMPISTEELRPGWELRRGNYLDETDDDEDDLESELGSAFAFYGSRSDEPVAPNAEHADLTVKFLNVTKSRLSVELNGRITETLETLYPGWDTHARLEGKFTVPILPLNELWLPNRR